MNRPYKDVPMIALIILIENYTKMVKDNENYQKDLDLMIQEIDIRFNKADDKQITIDEYIRRRNGEGN